MSVSGSWTQAARLTPLLQYQPDDHAVVVVVVVVAVHVAFWHFLACFCACATHGTRAANRAALFACQRRQMTGQ